MFRDYLNQSFSPTMILSDSMSSADAPSDSAPRTGSITVKASRKRTASNVNSDGHDAVTAISDIEKETKARASASTLMHAFTATATDTRYVTSLARIVRELPWLLQHSGSAEQLKACLCIPMVFDRLFAALVDRGENDLLRYWHSVSRGILV